MMDHMTRENEVTEFLSCLFTNTATPQKRALLAGEVYSW